MDILSQLLQFAHYALSFAGVILVVVFIHEFGHYIAAKKMGVRVEVFSIGFGKELFGWNDASGTRWKICLLPLGGYVKMFGDSNPASSPDFAQLEKLSPEEASKAFHTKPLFAKALIVAAGPLANFLFAIVIMSIFFTSSGRPSVDPIVTQVLSEGPAAKAGLRPGDKIIEINGQAVKEFSDLKREIEFAVEETLTLTIDRNNALLKKEITPIKQTSQDVFGNAVTRKIIGITSEHISYKKISLLESIHVSIKETYRLCTDTLRAVWQMIRGQRSTEDLKGPIGIAKYSGQAASQGMQVFIWYIIILSINLGLMNLFPIPLLDGGHLLYYAIEAIQGRPMAVKIQQFGFKIGLALLIGLAFFSTFNDLKDLKLF